MEEAKVQAKVLVLKETSIESATDTTITIGRYEWTVVRRTVAGVVTFDKQGATEGLIQDYWAFIALGEDDLYAEKRHELFRGEGLFCVLKQITNRMGRDGVYFNMKSMAGGIVYPAMMELLGKVFSHVLLLEQQQQGDDTDELFRLLDDNSSVPAS